MVSDLSLLAKCIVQEILTTPRIPSYKEWWLASLLRSVFEEKEMREDIYSGKVQELQFLLGEMDMRIQELEQEVQRLKEGDFTPEELQNLCHRFQREDALSFFQGCQDYQRRLFGYSSEDLQRQCQRDPQGHLYHQQNPQGCQHQRHPRDQEYRQDQGEGKGAQEERRLAGMLKDVENQQDQGEGNGVREVTAQEGATPR